MASPRKRPTAAYVKWALAAEVDRLRDDNTRLADENERLRAGQGGISISLPDPCRSQVEIDEFISKMKLEHPDITEKEEAELRRGYAVGMVFFRNTTSGNGFISVEIENAKFIEETGYGIAIDRVVFCANRKGGKDGE